MNAVPSFSLGNGESPSTLFVPSFERYAASFTGAATYGLPIAVPAGPGGMKPDLMLTYNSAQTETGDVLTLKQSPWVGKGFSLSLPSIARVKRGSAEQDYFSLSLGGRSYTLVRGQRISGAPADVRYSTNWLQGWEWLATDEAFLKVRAVNLGTLSSGQASAENYKWVVWAKDGTKYEFARSTWWGWQDSSGACELGSFQQYRWMLSSVTDPSGNSMTYEYTPVNVAQSCWTTQVDIYPTSVSWGGNLIAGTPDRFRVLFTSDWRGAGGDAVSPAEDMDWDFPGAIYGGKRASPHETRKLTALSVQSKQGSSWERVREYRFEYEPWAAAGGSPLYSDAYVCSGTCNDDVGSFGPDPAYRKLTLKSVQLVGADGSSFPVRTSFSYHTSRGTTKRANGGWNRLASVSNGQGGTLSFNYENISQVYYNRSPRPSWFNLFFNHHRVISTTRSDGRGNSYLTTLGYGEAQKNSWGNTVRGHGSDTSFGRGPNAFPNSAALVFWDLAGQPPGTTAVTKEREFRGHAWVSQKSYAGSTTSTPLLEWVERHYHQGDVGCVPTEANSNNPCFVALRDREFQVGEVHTTIWRNPSGYRVRETNGDYRSAFYPFTAYQGSETWPEYTNNGLWRAFRYLAQVTDKTIDEASGFSRTQARTTKFYYDAANQGGNTQYGNLTKREDYDGTRLYRTNAHFYTRNVAETWNWNGAGPNVPTFSVRWIVDPKWAEETSDASGRKLSLSQWYYDGFDQTPMSVGDRGLVTRESRYYNVPLTSSSQGTTLLGPDVTYTYDTWGNRASETTYAGPGSRLYDGNAFTISPAGCASTPCSAARTTRVTYDGTYHVYPTQITYPIASLVESATYDLRLGLRTSIVAVNGGTTSASYDTFGRILRIAKPYDDLSAPTLTFSYRDADRPVRYEVQARENSSGARFTQLYFDGLGRQIQVKRESTDPNGTSADVVVDKAFDALDRVVAHSTPRHVPVSTAYTAPSSPLYQATQTAYDALDRITRITQPNGTFVSRDYGVWEPSSGVFVTMDNAIDENRHLVSRYYDAFGRLTTVREFTGNCGASARGPWAYDCAAPYTASWALYSTTSYAYSERDDLKQVTDAVGKLTTNAFDTLSRKVSTSDPNMGSWSYAYDTNGNLTRQRDARGQRVCFYYDSMNRLTGKHYNGTSDACPATPGTISYVYDGNQNGRGKRTSMRDPSGQSVWTYDSRGRVTHLAKTIDGLSYNYGTAWAYDDGDRVTSMTYAPGEVVNFGYDRGWRVNSVSGTNAYVTSASYDAFDRPLVRNYGSASLRQTHAYFGATEAGGSRLRQLSAGTTSSPASIQDLRYTYDATGNVSRIDDYFGYGRQIAAQSAADESVAGDSQSAGLELVDTESAEFASAWMEALAAGGASGDAAEADPIPIPCQGQGARCDSGLHCCSGLSCGDGICAAPPSAPSPLVQSSFSYDDMNRLLRVVGSNTAGTLYDERYAYNQVGNLTNKEGVGYTYGDANHPQAVTGAGSNTYAYDANGNQTRRVVGGVTEDLTYDAENQLVRINRAGALFETYVYDGDGQRVLTTRADGGKTGFVGDWFEISAPAGAARINKSYYSVGRARLAVRDGSTLYYLLSDQLGSQALTLSTSGAVVGTTSYKAFGSVRRSTGGTPSSFNFAGQRRDASNLLYYGARYYDSDLGRFITPDAVVGTGPGGQGGTALRSLTVDFHEPGFIATLGNEHRGARTPVAGPMNPQALNRYAYVLNNPVNYIDPSGHYVDVPWEEAEDVRQILREAQSTLEGYQQGERLTWHGAGVALSGLAAVRVGAIVASAVKDIWKWGVGVGGSSGTVIANNTLQPDVTYAREGAGVMDFLADGVEKYQYLNPTGGDPIQIWTEERVVSYREEHWRGYRVAKTSKYYVHYMFHDQYGNVHTASKEISPHVYRTMPALQGAPPTASGSPGVK